MRKHLKEDWFLYIIIMVVVTKNKPFMKYYLLLLSTFLIFIATTYAQKTQHQIVFDMSSSDTAHYSTVIRQVNNVLKASPETKIEVGFHGKAVYALVNDKTTLKEKIDDLVNNKHVKFPPATTRFCVSISLKMI